MSGSCLVSVRAPTRACVCSIVNFKSFSSRIDPSCCVHVQVDRSLKVHGRLDLNRSRCVLVYHDTTHQILKRENLDLLTCHIGISHFLSNAPPDVFFSEWHDLYVQAKMSHRYKGMPESTQLFFSHIPTMNFIFWPSPTGCTIERKQFSIK